MVNRVGRIRRGVERTASGETLEYKWAAGTRGYFEGIVVLRTDRFGQRWRLELNRGGHVTVRVAAGLLDVTPMTITNWIRAGVFPHAQKNKKTKVVMIPDHEVEQVARQRGVVLPFDE